MDRSLFLVPAASARVCGEGSAGEGRPFRPDRAKWVIIFATCFLAAVPYVAGYLASTAEYHFQGAVDYVPDVQSYFMWMRSSAEHPGLPPNLYHTTPEKPRFFHLLWWSIGKVSRHTGIGITLLYHLTHLVGAVLFLLALWRFVNRFFTDRRWSGVAYGVCSLGSGVGWYTLIVDPTLVPILRTKPALPRVSLDLWSADVNTFYSLLACPHYSVALWLVVEALDRLYKGITTEDIRACTVGALFVFVLGFVHVYDMFMLAPLALVFAAAWCKMGTLNDPARRPQKSKTVLGAFWFVLAAVLPVLFYAAAVYQSPSLASWARQNVLPTPGPHLYLQAFGLPGLLMLSYRQALSRIRRGEPAMLFLVIWVVTTLLLMYIYPLLPFAKRVAEGVHIPVVILGVRSLADQWVPWAERRLRATRRHAVILSIMGIGLIMPTSLFLVSNKTVGTTSRRPPFFITGAEWAACRYLEQHADRTKAILAPWQTGNFLPRYTGMRVYVGHPHITPDYKRRGRLVHKFLWGYMSETEMERFLRENRIGYVWLGRRKAKYVALFPADSQLLRPWFESGFVTIYEVVLPNRPATRRHKAEDNVRKGKRGKRNHP